MNYQQIQQPVFNPFRQSMMMPQQTGFMQPQMTGYPNGMQQQQPFLQPQQTGAMAFGNQQPMFQPPQPFQPTPQQPFMQPSQTGFQSSQPGMQPQQTGFLQSQSTGPNPFRQSVMANTATGNMGAPFSQPASPFGQSSSHNMGQDIQRSGSTPVKPLVSQPTGSKNPFAPAPGQAQRSATVSSRGPTMNELAMGFGRDQGQQQQSQGQSPWATVNGKSSNGTGIADVASSFVFDAPKTNNANDDFMAQFGGLSVNTSTGPSSNTNSSTSPSNQFSFNNAFGGAPNASSPSTEFLQPQQTGFGGSAIKPFKPTSSFGSQLLDGLAPVVSPTASPGVGASPHAASGGVQAQSTGYPGMSGGSQQGQFGAFGTGGMGQQGTGGGGAQQGQGPFGAFGGMGQQSTGAGGGAGQQTQFGGLGAQMTGGQPNPFRQNTMSPGGGGGAGNLAFGQQGAFGANSPFAGQNNPQFGQGQGQGQGQGGFGQQGGSLI
jgi:hypothetical protein